MNLSKSRYCSAVQCPKMLWMAQHMPEHFDGSVMNEAILNTGNEVGDLAMGYFGEYFEVEYDDDRQKMLAETQQLLAARVPVICEATFAFDGDLCMVDILRVFDGYVELVEVKSSTECKQIYLHDIAFQYYILTRCGLDVRRASLMHINNQYVRWGELDTHGFFTLEDHTAEALGLQPAIESRIARFKATAEQPDEPDIGIGAHCGDPYECGYKQWCWRDVPRNSVFDVARLHSERKWSYYHRGIVTFRDLLATGDQFSITQTQQMLAETELLPAQINREAIREWLSELRYPLYHLDFETMNTAIPQFDGVKPFQQIPFQYSLHIEQADGSLEHREFLGDGVTDPRRALAERLCADITDDACVLAYNMGFEKGRLREIAELFPDLRSRLLAIHDNVRDLMLPFQRGDYYDRAQRGSYSIKLVLPALCGGDPELDYHALDLVHDGGEASATYPALASMSPGERERARRALLAYCRLDTLAMVKILEKLRAALIR